MSELKRKLEKILPRKLYNIILKLNDRYNVNEFYNSDKKRLSKYAYRLNQDKSVVNLRSQITFHYHAIEKGLSHKDLRLGFGIEALNNLFISLDKYIYKGYPLDDIRFQTALSVLESYIKVHNINNFEIPAIEEKYAEYVKFKTTNLEQIGGVHLINREQLPEFNNLPFKDLAENRHSVRDFGDEDISDECVLEAINIAKKTPSVCNRQSWKVRYIKNPLLVKKVLQIQGGLRGKRENLNKILVVTADKQYMAHAHERNQTYIDGGLFAMSLIYSLTSKNIATCALNASFSYKQDKDMREFLSIHESEDLILFIAIGSYPENFRIPKSFRDKTTEFTQVIE